MMIHDIKTKHHGEQELARVVLSVIPLIEKHFSPFNGQRGRIASGSSAKFNKVVQAFRDECEALTDARIWVKNDEYSCYINIDIHTPNPDGVSCSYYKDYIYIGEYKSLGNFERSQDYSYTFKPDETRAACQRILDTSADDIEKAKEQIENLKDEIEKVQGSIPYTFRDCLPSC